MADHRHWIRPAVRGAVIAIVCYFVARGVTTGIAGLGEVEWKLRPRWFVAAAFVYLAAWLPVWWFWHRSVVMLGQNPGIYESLRAYYVSHLGKYVPGKAMVIVLRVGLLDRSHCRRAPGVASVFIETLTNMAVGGGIAAVCLVPLASEHPVLGWIGIALMIAAGIPTLPPILNRILDRLATSRIAAPSGDMTSESPSEHPSPRPMAANGDERRGRGISWFHILSAWPQLAAGWVVQGASLGLVLCGMSITAFTGFEDWVMYTGGVAIAVVAGFLSGIPGGIGIRDGLLVMALAEGIGPEMAVVAAALWRLTSLVSEAFVSAILYLVKPRSGA